MVSAIPEGLGGGLSAGAFLAAKDSLCTIGTSTSAGSGGGSRFAERQLTNGVANRNAAVSHARPTRGAVRAVAQRELLDAEAAGMLPDPGIGTPRVGPVFGARAAVIGRP